MANRLKLSAAVLAAAAVAAGARVWSQDTPADPADAPPPGELVCRLDRLSAVPGQTVRLTSLTRADPEVTVREVWHRIVRVADYDPKAGRLKNLKADAFRPELPFDDRVLDGLPHNLTTAGARGALLWAVQTPRAKGLEFEFKPKFLGAFLIYTKWEFTTTREQIEGPPVLLVVRPPVDAKGRTVVRPEWLDTDAP